MNEQIDFYSELIGNYEILNGLYFDDCRFLKSRFTVFRSSVFPDIGWNYVAAAEGSLNLSTPVADEIRALNLPIDPYFVFVDEQNVTIEGKQIKSEGDFSVWMSCDRETFIDGDRRAQFEILDSVSTSDCREAVDAFREAYCNNLDGQIGYNDLEEYYPRGFEYFLKDSGDRSFLVILRDEKKIIALASLVMHPSGSLAGLYNVAVVPAKRAVGLGREISSAATGLAFEKGAKRCILQTESHTPVQKLYQSLGYNVSFHMQYAELPK